MKIELKIKHTRLDYDTWNINQQEYYQTSVENEKWISELCKARRNTNGLPE